jgi:hypothetical protein
LPGVSIKSPELNALHISQIQGMVNLNGERSKDVEGAPGGRQKPNMFGL